MYTQLHIGTRLDEKIPPVVKNTLDFMVGNTDEAPEHLPNHELFRHARWEFMLRCDSYYFDYKTHSLFKYDDIGNHYWLNVTCNLKNYENEIALFLDWIYDYLEDKQIDQFIGYMRYEEDDMPTLILKDKMKRTNK